MNPFAQSGRYPMFEVDRRQSLDRRRRHAIAVPATRPTHPAGLDVAVLDRSARPPTPLLAAIRRLAAILRQWRWRARSRRDLPTLGDHMLKDIGLTRAEAQHEAAKPFWR